MKPFIARAFAWATAHKKILLIFSAVVLGTTLLVVAGFAWLYQQGVSVRVLARTLLPPAAKAEHFPNWQQTPLLAKVRFAVNYEVSHKGESIFARHLGSVTPAAMLDFVELRHPFCHHEAHDLGVAILAQTQDVVKAMETCDIRCTNGCMHGVLGQVFVQAPKAKVSSDGTAPALSPDSLCTEVTVTKRHKPGNCAHAIGHALMKLHAAKPERALTDCEKFTDQSMEYYCATGVYMGYEEQGDDGVANHTKRIHKHETAEDEEQGDDGVAHRTTAQFPCTADTKFPAACYRYFLRHITEDKPSDEQLLAHCLSLPDRRRMGCFHGLGRHFQGTVAKTPDALHRVCEKGSDADRALCIEGAIEKLSDYESALAERACRSIVGKDQEICLAAAHDGMYRLTKPTMTYYLADR